MVLFVIAKYYEGSHGYHWARLSMVKGYEYRDHDTYGAASILALFGGALFAFVNPTGLESLIKNRPIVALTLGMLFVL